MVDKKLTELDAITAVTSDDLIYVVDDPLVTPVSKKIRVDDFIASFLQSFQLINEIKGWPPCVKTGDLDALNLWWDKIGTPTTAPTVTDTSGEGITDTYELCIKLTADASGEGLYQRFTYANEPRVKSGRRLSTLWAIWCVGGVGATLSIINQTAEETVAAEVTAAAWTIVEVPNHLCAGTYVDIKILADGAGTFYAVPLGANIGARGIPLKPRGWIHIDCATVEVVSGVDPAGSAGIDADFTASTSNLCTAVQVNITSQNNTTDSKHTYLRRNGSGDWFSALFQHSKTYYWGSNAICQVDDGQILEWKTDGVAADAESCYILLLSYWEWE